MNAINRDIMNTIDKDETEMKRASLVNCHPGSQVSEDRKIASLKLVRIMVFSY